MSINTGPVLAHTTLSSDTVKNDSSLVAQVWFASDDPCVGQQYLNQTITRPVVVLTHSGHINQNTTGAVVECCFKNISIVARLDLLYICVLCGILFCHTIMF